MYGGLRFHSFEMGGYLSIYILVGVLFWHIHSVVIAVVIFPSSFLVLFFCNLVFLSSCVEFLSTLIISFFLGTASIYSYLFQIFTHFLLTVCVGYPIRKVHWRWDWSKISYQEGEYLHTTVPTKVLPVLATSEISFQSEISVWVDITQWKGGERDEMRSSNSTKQSESVDPKSSETHTGRPII